MYFFVLEYVLSSGISAVLHPEALVKYVNAYEPVPMTINESVKKDKTGTVNWASNAISIKDYPVGTIRNINFSILFKSAGNSDTIENLFSHATAILKYEDGTIYKAQNIIALSPGAAVGDKFLVFECVRLEGP